MLDGFCSSREGDRASTVYRCVTLVRRAKVTRCERWLGMPGFSPTSLPFTPSSTKLHARWNAISIIEDKKLEHFEFRSAIAHPSALADLPSRPRPRLATEERARAFRSDRNARTGFGKRAVD
ncbi:hypothetical protein KM043_000569 [Ampulex compressa]|nr:hypothetical protein KM043_000569 [Ampulex compressa]